MKEEIGKYSFKNNLYQEGEGSGGIIWRYVGEK